MMWELDHKEGWAKKNWFFWIVVLEKTLESTLDCKEIKLVNLKRNQLWIFIGRTDAEAEAPIFLATWCKEPTHWKRPWCWEGLGAGRKGDDRGWDGWMAITDSMDVSLSELWELVMDREAWSALIHRFAKSPTWLCECTELMLLMMMFLIKHLLWSA